MLIQPVWRELLERRNDWLLEDNREAVEWRRGLIRRARLQNVALFSDMALSAKTARGALADKYAHACKHDLEMESEVATAYDVRDLLDLALDRGKGEIHQRKRFESLSFADQGCQLAVIDTVDSCRAISEDLNRLIVEVRTRLFADHSMHVNVETLHDPEASYRVTAVGVGQELTPGNGELKRSTSLVCRVLKNGGLAYFDPRLKTPYETYLKVLRRSVAGEEDPFAVADRCGLKFVVPSVEEAFALRDALLGFAGDIGGQVNALQENLSAAGRVDPNNRSSSSNFRAVKLLMTWAERLYEIQIQTLQDYLSSQYSTGDENHEKYKQDVCLSTYFPILFPGAIYGQDWSDPHVRERLREQKRMQLNWRVEGKRP